MTSGAHFLLIIIIMVLEQKSEITFFERDVLNYVHFCGNIILLVGGLGWHCCCLSFTFSQVDQEFGRHTPNTAFCY